MARKPKRNKKQRASAAPKRGGRRTRRKAAQPATPRPPAAAAAPDSTDSAPAWLKPLLDDCPANQRRFVETLIGRASPPLTDIEQLADLVQSPKEAARLGKLLDRLPPFDAAEPSVPSAPLPLCPSATPPDDPDTVAAAQELLAREQNADAGDRHRERSRRRQASISAATRDISPLRPVEDTERRDSCQDSLKRFCETYHQPWFPLAWSQTQLEAIELLEKTVLSGGLHAFCMPRGEGKTTLCIAAVEWAMFYGHHQYSMLIGANDDKAQELLDGLKTDIESNDLLYEDFPEVCYPVRCLEGIVNRAKGQTLDGEPTGIEWRGRRKIVLPTVDGSACSGAVVKAAGWGSSIRGAIHTTRNGRRIRPGLLVMDDLQTDESARSPAACDKLLRTVNGGMLGLAGAGQKISAMFPCTIIEPGDAADEITNREKNPEWHGRRSAMIRAWPHATGIELWEKYHELRQEAFHAKHKPRDGDDPAPKATAFYVTHRAEMDDGFEVSWPARKLSWELSAQQHAMHLYERNRVAFFSEYQNLQMTVRSPAHPSTTDDLRLESDLLATRLSGYARGKLPPETQWVTGFIDVHQRVLYWMLCAFAPDFSGAIIDYGTFPEAKTRTYYASSFRPALKDLFPGSGQEGALTSALQSLTDTLFARRFRRTDGVEFSPSLVPIDTGYMATTIRRFVESSKHRGALLCALGRQCGPNDVPFREYRQRAGERIGEDWLIRRPVKTAFRAQHLLTDTYAWKSFAARRLLAARGDPGAITIYGEDGSKTRHDFLAQHFTAEIAQSTEGRHRVNVWSMRPGATENHFWDCFVGCCVAASIQGAKLGGGETVARAPRAARTRLNLQGPDGRSFFITR